MKNYYEQLVDQHNFEALCECPCAECREKIREEMRKAYRLGRYALAGELHACLWRTSQQKRKGLK